MLHCEHGESHTRLYKIWRAIIKRCTKPKSVNYAYYGGRGITVCEAWEHDYAIFKTWALTNGYKNNLTIDRIDVDKGYSPENCRWATAEEQGSNKRNNVNWTYQGQTKHVSAWAKIIGISRTALMFRVTRSGWSIEKALSTPGRPYPRG